MACKIKPEDSLSEIVAVSGECACFNLRKATRVITRLFDKIIKPSGLNGTQYTLLVALAATKNPAISLLARRLNMNRTTLTRNLRPLEKEGLVRIRRGKDQRTCIITLSDKGRASLLKAYPLWQKAQKSIVEKFGEAEWKDMVHGMKRLTDLAER